ncbi:MAG: HK97 family phage prohead protease [Bacteroidales bacterium]|jgi:HK97 family phage prohead protease|nr:HK97 family phage prohead protease [Bacteroidales bacterium]
MGKLINKYRLKGTIQDIQEEKGIVTVAVNAFGNLDAQGDISMQGSFTKTLNENFDRVKHLYFHDPTRIIGCPIEGYESNKQLVFKSEIARDVQDGKEALALYILYNKYGKTLEHSIGAIDIKRDAIDNRKVTEWKLYEFSTVSWGANEQTPLIDLKSLNTRTKVESTMTFLREFARQKFSDELLQKAEEHIHYIEKAFNGDGQLMTTCPHCGLLFDYNSVEEITYEKHILDTARNYQRWLLDDVVYEEIQKLKPEIRDRVIDIINTKKDIGSSFSHICCPKCYNKIYRSDIEKEPGQTTQKKEAASSTSLWSFEAINRILK